MQAGNKRGREQHQRRRKERAGHQHTAEVKYALRVLLREYSSPTPALHRLNTFLMDSRRLDARPDDALVCVAIAIVDARTGTTEIAAAGMEPPLLVRAANGRTEPVPADGPSTGPSSAAGPPAASARASG